MNENKIFNVSPDWSENSLINKKKYDQWYKDSIDNNESFWDEHGKRIEWIKPYSKIKNVNYLKENFSIKW